VPYLQKIKNEIVNRVSDFGWEIGSVEYEIDMISDEDEGFRKMLQQEEKEIHLACSVNKTKNNNKSAHLSENIE
jgi:hypothetical protein